MTEIQPGTGAGEGKVCPCLRYSDAVAAIDWLCRVVGFEQQLVVPDGQGGIAHAQLTLGAGLVMLSSDREDQYGFRAPHPDGTGAAMCCFLISRIDDLYAKVMAAGVAALEGGVIETDYGSRCFTIKDPEGHLWHFGTYDPWQAPA